MAADTLTPLVPTPLRYLEEKVELFATNTFVVIFVDFVEEVRRSHLLLEKIKHVQGVQIVGSWRLNPPQHLFTAEGLHGEDDVIVYL